MVIHAVSTISKNPSLSKEEFDKYWSESHGQLFMANPLAQRYVLKYSQYHFDAKEVAALQKAGFKTNIADADGIANFWFNSLEDLKQVFESEYYHKVVRPDEEKMLDTSKTTLVLGYDDDKWDDGKPGKFITAGA